MSKFSRRTLLKSAVAASTAFPLFTIAGTKASGRVIGANDTIRIGVAGINGRGVSHIDEFTPQKNVDVTYLIDPDTSLFGSRKKMVKDLKMANGKGGTEPACVKDIREALEDKNLDAVSVATCNHWHSLITIWACQAGKDVYVEKPMSHNVFEGRKCVEAAAKYGRVVQHGTQQRSDKGRAQQIAAIKSGKYGKLLVSKGYCCKPRWSIDFKPVKAPPPGFDFNIWLGPAPQQDYHENIVHYNWHWFWDFGNGDMGNQGVHEMDVARWAIPDGTLPNRVWSLGGRFFPTGPDQGQTPNMQLAVYEYGDVLLVFETRGLVDNKNYPKSPSRNVSNEFYTTEGKIIDWQFYPHNGGKEQPVEGDKSVTVTPGGAFGAFIAAMRSRKPEDINCDAEVAHYSSALCHLGNISYRLGQSAKWEERAKTLGNNPQVAESFEALKDNLSAVDIKLAETTYNVGRVLNLDPKAEKFIDDDEANALLTRPYREPFVVPAQV